MPPMPPPTAQITVLHDARAVHDCSRSVFSQFIVNGQPVWMVIELVPGGRSGSGTIPGAHIQAETGQLVTPGGSQPVILKEGQWKLLNSARQADSSGGPYSWTEPMVDKRTLSPEEHYSPFVYGGRILASRIAGASGIAQFGPVVLLPEGFDRFVAAAFTVAQQTPALLANDGRTREAVARLTALLHQDNDLVAAQAFRTLLEAGGLSTDTLREAVAGARGYRLSMFLYLLLTGRAGGEPSGRIVSSAAERRDADSLRMVALAAFTVATLSPPVRPTNSLLSSLLTQLKAEKITRGRDAYLDAILAMLGLSQ
jgi:hypothetical protein